MSQFKEQKKVKKWTKIHVEKLETVETKKLSIHVIHKKGKGKKKEKVEYRNETLKKVPATISH
jgi:hypothetical protein